MVVNSLIVIDGIFSANHFVPGKMNGKLMPYVLRLQRGPHPGLAKIEPSPSEFAENVNSFTSVGVRVLTRLSAPVRFGRDQSDWNNPSVPSNGPSKCHGICVPRKLMCSFSVSI